MTKNVQPKDGKTRVVAIESLIGRPQKLMGPKMQRAATGWLLPLALVILSPLIMKAAWLTYRRKEKAKRLSEYLNFS